MRDPDPQKSRQDAQLALEKATWRLRELWAVHLFSYSGSRMDRGDPDRAQPLPELLGSLDRLSLLLFLVCGKCLVMGVRDPREHRDK
jgi:hypothetical protein